MRASGLVVALALFVAGCSGAKTEDPKRERTLDASTEYQWGPEKLKLTILQANAGDVRAARELYDYYAAHGDERHLVKWENWLVERGDPEAMGTRSSGLFLQATRLSDSSEEKLALLRESETLAVRSEDARRSGGADRTLVNGRWVTGKSTRDGDFIQRVRQEIRRVEQVGK
jgi:hypothetical protein